MDSAAKVKVTAAITTTTTEPAATRARTAASFGRRHRRPVANARLSTGEIKRLARRGGVRRMGGGTADAMRSALRGFLTGVIKDAVVLCEHSRRRTVYASDVVLALKRSGSSSWHTVLYGFDGPTDHHRRRPRRRAVAEPPTDGPAATAPTEGGDDRGTEEEEAAAADVSGEVPPPSTTTTAATPVA